MNGEISPATVAPRFGGASTAWPRDPARATIILIFLTLPVRLVIAACTGFGFGESYYMLGAVDPQLSYFDQPPLAFWLAWLSSQLGVTALMLRLPFILCFAATTWLMFLLGKKLFGPLAGFYAALLLNLSAVFTVTTASWLQPDAPLMLFWLATALCLAHIFRLGPGAPPPDDPAAVRAGSLKWWLLAGVLLGLTTLSKYHAAFLFAGAWLCALTCRPLRHWLWHPGPYLALAVNFVIASPIFLWNAAHGWVSFLFQGGRAGGGAAFALHWDWLLGSLVGQALWLLPWVWLPLVWMLVDCFRRGPGDRARWFCACTAILPIVFFTVVTLWAKLGFHFHWQAPGYLMLFPPLGAAAANWMQSAVMKRRVWARRWLWLSGVACVFMMVVLQVHAATGFWGKRWLGPAFWAGLFNEEDPTLEGFDYDALRARFAAEGWDKDPNVFVAATRWHQGGKAGWALRGEKPVLVLHDDPRNLAYLVDQRALLGKDAVLVAREEFTPPEKAFALARKHFAEVVRLPDVDVVRGGVKEFTLPIYYCRNFQRPYEYPAWYRLGGAGAGAAGKTRGGAPAGQ